MSYIGRKIMDCGKIWTILPLLFITQILGESPTKPLRHSWELLEPRNSHLVRPEPTLMKRLAVSNISSLLYQDAQIDTFVSVWLESYTYLENNLIESIKREWYLDDPLITDWWDTFTYDPNGRIIEKFRRARPWQGESWLDWEKTLYQYDDSGQLDSLHFLAWYDSWEDVYQIDLNYDESGRLINEVQQGWIPQSQIWVNTYQETYTYQDSLPSTWLRQTWETSIWENSEYYSYTYNEAGHHVETIRQTWREDDWINFRRLILSYTDEGELQEMITQNALDNQWSDLSKDSYNYDNNMHLTNWLTSRWSENDGAWINQFQVNYNRNDTGDLENWLRQSWINGNWWDYGRLLYNYTIPTHLDSENEDLVIPEPLNLANYPNPFNPITSICYSLPEQSTVKLTIFDIRGREVFTFYHAVEPPGNYAVQWNGVDKAGDYVGTGLYFCRLEAGSYSQTIKMVLVK